MNKFIAIITVVLMSALSGFAYGNDVYVNGYTRSDGTRVEGHYRSAPNSTKSDNWSTKGNTNPYTGKKGTKSLGNPYGW